MKKILLMIALLAIVPGLKAQQQRVTSVLEVLDTQTGERRVVREYRGTIEAPNWSKDGRWLIYNSGGYIYRVSPDGKGDVGLVHTHYLSTCNNDHVLSADGKYIAVSSGPSGNGGGSYVYVISLDGKEAPRLVTPTSPSYLHGWSPDGKTIAYCAMRDNNSIQDIYVMNADGTGEERRLTFADDLDDGPEFSPDGKYIWFNSVRTGLMQVWRMKADGSEQTQMTFDETRNAWFPHVSPDGKKVIYITYKKGDLEPNQHLPNKNVELWLMPAGGGQPKKIAELFGGQGTINVNSWSPDSRYVAFVSYRLRD